jgi:acyl-CoA reductase-like NAD-dependent aldehyde dehydrogenase
VKEESESYTPEVGGFTPFVNPATGENFGQVRNSTMAEIEEAMSHLREVQPAWKRKTVRQRMQLLKLLLQTMLDRIDEISLVISQNTGKSRQDAMVEIFMVADNLSYQLKYAPRWLARQHAARGLYLFKHGYVEHEPHGVVAVIGPWNYPWTLTMPPVLSALLTGNTVIVKPSEVAASTGVMLERMFTDLPGLKPYVRVIHGGPETGAAIIQSKPDYIFLTGSVQTGRKVLMAASEQLIPCSLELGGKDAMIVLEDADLEAAARWGLWGALYNAGQTCVSIERVYVVEPVYDRFLQLVLEQASRIKVGFSSEPESPYHMGPICDLRQIRIIEQHIGDAIQRGARLLIVSSRQGNYIYPMVLVDVDHDMLLMKEETFGPIMPIMKVRDEAEAISLANDSSYGLSASVWSRDIQRAERVARQIEAGSVIINDVAAQFGVPSLPFGGIKQSGAGRVHGKVGLMQFTRPRSYLIGDAPKPYDLITVMREPHHYRLGVDLMRLLFSVTFKHRMRPVMERLGFKKRSKN